MRHALLVAVLLGTTMAVAAEELPLRVMTFNVRYGTAMDGQNAWSKRRDILVNCVKTASPDILGVQECLDFQAEYIAGQLPEYRWLGIGRDQNGKGEMTAVLYRHAGLVPVSVRHFWLSEQPDVPGSVSWDSSLTRMATLVRFHHPATGRFFLYVNTHFDHKGEQARQESVGVVNRELEKEDQTLPVIFTGDYNAMAENSEPYRRAMDAGFRDAWTEAPERRGPPLTWSAFEAPKEGVDSRIDWILFRGAVEPQWCETVLHNEGGRYPSDHYPVLALLTLK